MRSQPVVLAALAYATAITALCPCRATLSCHLPHYFISVGLATSLVAYENFM